MAKLQTVLGPVPESRFGLILPHEHVLCDFVGADRTGRHRWDVATVARAMQPHLEAAKAQGVTGFVDCTPAWIGRDPRLLKLLAERTGLHILTNTGLYGGADDKYVPAYAWRESADDLAVRWILEWERGIEDTGVRPGFVKIGVDAVGSGGTLSEIDRKLVTAAARTSRETGLSVTCHTGDGDGGLAAARAFVHAGGRPERFVVAHSDGHGAEFNRRVAELGAWVSFDGFGWRDLDPHLALLDPILASHPERLLLSMDHGWYFAGEPNGGAIRGYGFLVERALPALRARGVPERTLRRLTVENPRSVFALATPAP